MTMLQIALDAILLFADCAIPKSILHYLHQYFHILIHTLTLLNFHPYLLTGYHTLVFVIIKNNVPNTRILIALFLIFLLILIMSTVRLVIFFNSFTVDVTHSRLHLIVYNY